MSEAKLNKILVGVDLLQSRQGHFSPPVMEAVKQSLGIAERTSGEVTFFAAIELPTDDESYVPVLDRGRIVSEIEASAEEELNKLVEQAAARGVRATSKLADGQGWVELTREAIDGEYDLVVVGSRHAGAVRRVLFGSTAMKLLRNCPRPVWVARPEPLRTPANVLVASDFSEVSDQALRLALGIATSSGAKVHLIHVLERPYAQLWDAGLVEARREQWYHEQDRTKAEHRLPQR
ncbi:MAG: hypothetical protein B7Z73_07160 [Planctomycetia bacterium 21-64-5]|nr:MAG: hypothetical protein B7Z73_07160 [Planctomycetia bacterium 21-64-5]